MNYFSLKSMKLLNRKIFGISFETSRYFTLNANFTRNDYVLNAMHWRRSFDCILENSRLREIPSKELLNKNKITVGFIES